MKRTSANSVSTCCAAVLLCAPLAALPVFSQSANDGFDPNVNGNVLAIAEQVDGKLLVGGTFSIAGGIARSNFARVLVDGVVDSAFSVNANAPVRCLAIQVNNNVLIGGDFTALAGQPRNRIARIGISGGLDTAFAPNVDGAVHCIALQADRKILLGGDFATIGGQACNSVGRLEANGTVDPTFHASANAAVAALATQPDGKVLVAGAFTTLSGEARERIGRLMPNGSLDQSFSPAANGPVNCILVQVDGKIVLGGEFTMLNGQPCGRIGRLNADGSLDVNFDPAANGAVSALARQADGKLLIGGSFTSLQGQARTNFCRLHPDGSLDGSFNLPADGSVRSIAVQSDSKVVFGGAFTRAGGVTRNHVARAYRDGSLDGTLAVEMMGGGIPYAASLAVHPDGKILLGGRFSNVAGQSRQGIARLNAGGSIDTTFVPSTGGTNAECIAVLGDGSIVVVGDFTNRFGLPTRLGRLSAGGSMDTSFDTPAVVTSPFGGYATATQPDGKTLVRRLINSVDGHMRTNIARLNFDGSLDEAFVPSADALVSCLAVQPDGRILLGGFFQTVNGQPRNRIARLNEDGSLDFSFNPGVGDNTGTFASPLVETLLVQPDGKILAGGRFTTLGGQPRECLGRLNADGSIDSTFTNPRVESDIYSMALQADGKILIGGGFQSVGGLTRRHIARVHPGGSLDTTFNASATQTGLSLGIQDDGKILMGGYRLARLTSGYSARQSLAIDAAGTTVVWARSGASPEVSVVSFQISDDGITYDFLAVPSRISGGWRQSGLVLPVGQNFFIRARGRTTSGRANSSMGLIESVAQFYIPPPSLKSFAMESNGVFRFAFSNAPGIAYSVLASTNVSLPAALWEVLGAPVALGGGLYQFNDSAAANHPRRFYQLRWP